MPPYPRKVATPVRLKGRVYRPSRPFGLISLVPALRCPGCRRSVSYRRPRRTKESILSNIPVNDPDVLDNMAALFDSLSRALDLTDRLRHAGDQEEDPAPYYRAATALRRVVLSVASAAADDMSVPSASPSPSLPSPTAPSPFDDPSAGHARLTPEDVPGEGESAWEYIHRRLFEGSEIGPDWVCWVEDYHDPRNPAHAHQGTWIPEARPATDTGRVVAYDGEPYTAFAFGRNLLQIAAESPTDVLGNDGWEPAELFI